MWEPTNGADLCGVNNKILGRSSNFEIMFYGFPRECQNKSMSKIKISLTLKEK
jgi:hypothetical protein